MNLFVYWEYAERIYTYTENAQNKVNILTKFRCLYTENTRNESVRILRIRGMNLFVYWEYAEWICSYTENTRNESAYWEYAECTKSWISRRIRNKNRKYLKMFLRVCLAKSLKIKKSHASVPLSKLDPTVPKPFVIRTISLHKIFFPGYWNNEVIFMNYVFTIFFLFSVFCNFIRNIFVLIEGNYVI